MTIRHTLSSCILAFLLAPAVPVWADFRLERTFDAPADGEFTLVAGRGSVKVVGTPESTVRVLITSQRSDIERFIEFGFEETPSGVAVTGRLKRDTRFFGWLTWYRYQGLTFEVQVPRRIDVLVKTHGAPVSVSGIEGEVALSSSGAPIRARDIRGDLIAHTTGARVRIERIDGDARVTTSGARIDAFAVSGSLEARTRGAAIVVKGVGGNLDASTRGAPVRISDVDGRLQVDAPGGVIHLDSPEENLDTP